MKQHPYLLIILIALFTAGCTENPLLGVWKVKPGQGRFIIACKEITFREDYTECGGLAEDVYYEIEGNSVFVRSKFTDKLGIRSVYKIIDINTMTSGAFLGQKKLEYGRWSY